ncbi:hypothetical protein DL771_009977 [Monosporascus sp. 5C6A]|nr:hypothetical protein DL771_009977 [Monosporascus sp. 5C6A]
MAYAPVPDQGLGIHLASPNFQAPDQAPWEQDEHYGLSPNARFLPTPGGQKPSWSWFATLFANGSAVRSAADFNRTVTDNRVAYTGGPDMLVADVATSMTVAFRSFLGAGPVPGHAVSQQSFIHVQWGSAVLPIVVVVATALFLALAIHRTRRSETEPWKSSALAMLSTALTGMLGPVRCQRGPGCEKVTGEGR